MSNLNNRRKNIVYDSKIGLRPNPIRRSLPNSNLANLKLFNNYNFNVKSEREEEKLPYIPNSYNFGNEERAQSSNLPSISTFNLSTNTSYTPTVTVKSPRNDFLNRQFSKSNLKNLPEIVRPHSIGVSPRELAKKRSSVRKAELTGEYLQVLTYMDYIVNNNGNLGIKKANIMEVSRQNKSSQ